MPGMTVEKKLPSMKLFIIFQKKIFLEQSSDFLGPVKQRLIWLSDKTSEFPYSLTQSYTESSAALGSWT